MNESLRSTIIFSLGAAAGSVVTKSIPDGEVWGGDPAHFIMKTDEYAHKLYNKAKEWPWTSIKEIISKEELIRLRQDYFFKTSGLEGDANNSYK